MYKWSRRSFVGLSFAGLGSIALPAMARDGPWRPPDGAFDLTRTLIRELSDGERIVVARNWRVRFEWQGRGIAIQGRQTEVRVDAPSRIAPIAAIERQRSTDGKFPVLLSSDRLILAEGDGELDQDIEKALSVAERLIANSGMAPGARADVRKNLAQLQAAGSSMLDRLPRDLFFPRNPEFHDLRQINLPDGSRGEFEVSYAAAARADSGLLDRADRQIITRLGGAERVSSEHWELRTI